MSIAKYYRKMHCITKVIKVLKIVLKALMAAYHNNNRHESRTLVKSVFTFNYLKIIACQLHELLIGVNPDEIVKNILY